MYHTIEKKRRKLEQMREKLISSQCNALRELLPDGIIQQICEESSYFFRTRLLTPVVTIFHMIGAAIIREGSFQSAWHFSAQSAQSGSLAKARGRLPLKIWKKLHQWVVHQICQSHDSKNLWHGHRVIGLDGTCISMGDEAALAEYFGRSKSQHGMSRFPISRAVVAFNLFTMVCLHQKIGRYRTSEKALAEQVTAELHSGDIVVQDRGFYSYERFWELMQKQLHFIQRSHPKFKIESCQIVESLGPEGYLVDLPISKYARKNNQTLPKLLRLRVLKINARIKGQTQGFWITTSLLDSQIYPAHEIRSLYRRRWRVETLIEELKLWLGADILRSKSVEGIFKEIHARVIAYNLIHWLILEAAKKHHKKPERLSTSAALRLAAAHSLKMSTAPAWQLPYLYDELLSHIAKSIVPFRPNRHEPRLKKREDKTYSRLKIPRSEWKTLYAYAA